MTNSVLYQEIILFWHEIALQMSDPWKIFGIGAQFLFMMRFIVQWVASEKSKKSVIPPAFWYFSILGALSLLVYGIKQREPVIILGQSVPILIYVRNLYLLKKYENRTRAENIGSPSA